METPIEIARWRLSLPEFDFDVVHGAEIMHQIEEILLHFQTAADDYTPMEIDLLYRKTDRACNSNFICQKGIKRWYLFPLNVTSITTV